MIRMTSITVALLLLAVNPEADAALADRAKFPPDQQHNLVYLTTSTVAEADREKLVNVLRFVVPSLSSKPYLEEQLPQTVEGTNLLRLDLAGLGWEATYPVVLGQQFVPSYRPDLAHAKAIPIVADGLWFAATLLDPVETGDAQYQLLYGPKPPKTADEFLRVWGIQNDADYVFGMIEGASGVAVQRIRLIENRPGAKRNYGWITHDSAKIAGATDPLENLPNKARFDAQELIVGNPKWYGGQSGMLQAYFLANGKGERQEKAPADIVVDHTGIRGVEIRNSISCITCHTTGINPPTSDEFKAYIEAGARVSFLKKDDQRNTDRYLGSDVAKEVANNQQAYSDGVRLCNGLTAEANTKAFADVVRLYDAAVTLEQAARELYCPAKELQLALADYSRRYTLTGRLALLAEGKPISREQWKNSFKQAQEVIYLWSQNK
jgi:hypothetical protein